MARLSHHVSLSRSFLTTAMTAAQLTAGICARLQNAPPGEEDLFNTPHTVQFLSIKKVGPNSTTNNPAVDRHRIIMSDGVNFIQAMLATQLNYLVHENKIGKNTIAVLEKLTCNYVQEKRLIIVLALTPVCVADDKIGNPVQIGQAGNSEQADGSAAASTAAVVQSLPTPITQQQKQQHQPQQHQQPQQYQQPQQHQQPQQRQQPPAAKGGRAPSIYPIEGLSPYQNNWTIKARVTQKSDIKTWSNQRGEGKLFNVTLMDESGEIRGTGFNTVVDELYPRLEEGKVYFISKARVNLAKKKFSNLTNDYELSFERNTEVEECLETTNVPMIKYNFVPLAALENFAKDSTCDVIGIVKETGPLGEIISKMNRTIPKRDLTLVDKSGFSVRLTLWGKQAEQYNAEDSTVIAFKGVKVGDFGGRSLSMISSSTMSINPDIEEAFALRGWYDASGAEQSFQAHSNSMSAGLSSGGFNRAEMRNLNDVKESQLGSSDKVDYFSTQATIMHIKADNISYPACPTQGCNKKVIQEGTSWRCEKCDKSFDAPEHRYIISLAVADWSGQAWLQGFNDVGIAVFGMPANDLVEIKERDESAYNVIMHKANCNTFNFACRAKTDSYNDQVRVRYGISRINPLDYKEEAMILRDLLHSPWAR